MEINMTIAKTILNQIKTLDPMAIMAWGARDFVNMGDGLKFKTSGMVKWKGYVNIQYNSGTDLYDLKFFRIRNLKMVNDREYRDVTADYLVHIIDTVVG